MERRSLLNKQWDCVCGRRHFVPVRAVICGSGGLEQLPLVIKKETGAKSAVIVSDLITREIAAERAAKLLTTDGISVFEFVLPVKKPVADDKTALWLLSQVPAADVFISCGSGTITDLTKYAAFKKESPFVAVATAASMNGYASGIVALTQKGIKKTMAAAPALAVVADLDILCAAPLEMTRAGLGDVISKPVCMADWKLASLIKNEVFCRVPFEIIKDLESVYTKDAQLLGGRDPRVIAALTEALVFSGISMVIAGSSAPASGGEHLISHTLDMQADLKGREHDFHGAQVGVATLVSAALYEKVRSFDPAALNWERIKKQYEAKSKTEKISKYWGPLAAEVMKEYEKKHLPWPEKEKELHSVIRKWNKIMEEVGAFLSKPTEIKRILTEAGAKAHYSTLGVDKDEFKQAVLMALTMRSRYTILDLADDLNLLEPFVEEMINDHD